MSQGNKGNSPGSNQNTPKLTLQFEAASSLPSVFFFFSPQKSDNSLHGTHGRESSGCGMGISARAQQIQDEETSGKGEQLAPARALFLANICQGTQSRTVRSPEHRGAQVQAQGCVGAVGAISEVLGDKAPVARGPAPAGSHIPRRQGWEGSPEPPPGYREHLEQEWKRQQG